MKPRWPGSSGGIRGIVAIAHRCPCGEPDVVVTAPLLPDGTPFPTVYYATCPRLNAAIGRLEADGVMRRMEARLHEDADLAAAYRGAHEAYLADRNALERIEGLDAVSAGGMPLRVKCLHALAAQSLACGPGVNPLGDEVLELIGQWWVGSPCRGAGEGTGA